MTHLVSPLIRSELDNEMQEIIVFLKLFFNGPFLKEVSVILQNMQKPSFRCVVKFIYVELFKRVQALLQRTFLLDFNPSSLPFETERCLHLSKSSFCNAKGGT